MIPRTTIDAIREKVDLLDLIRDKGVNLKTSGINRYVGLCPVHTERSPSFNVNPLSQTFRCFGCGISGDAFSFLQELDGYTFAGAVEALGESVGVEVIDSAGEDPDYLRKKDYLETVKTAAWFYRTKFAELPEDHPAKEDLRQRNYLEVEGRETWLEDFGMGFAPGTGNALSSFLQSKGYSKERIVDAGLAFIMERNGQLRDRFRNRLLWELRDLKGHPIGFSGRRLNDEDNPKYLNTSETILYRKSKVLFGFDLARKKMATDKVCYVTEGAADAMALAAVGMTNVVASCGTSFGSDHATAIRRIIDEFDSKNNGKFIFVFDGDAAGLKATQKMFTDIKPSIKDRSYVVLLGDLDPVDYRVQFGDEVMQKALLEYIPITEFMLRRIAEKYNLQEIEERSNFVREAMALISHFNEPEIFDDYKRRISAMSGVAYANLRGGRLMEVAEPEPEYQYSNPYSEEQPPPPPDDAGDPYDDPFGGFEQPQPKHINKPLDRVSRLLVACMLQFPNETFEVLKSRGDVVNLLKDDSLKHLLVEGMNKTGYTATKGESTVLTSGDFTNSLASIEFFHLELQVELTRAGNYVSRLVKNLEEISKREESENLRAAIATKSLSEEDALRQLIQKRQAAKG